MASVKRGKKTSSANKKTDSRARKKQKEQNTNPEIKNEIIMISFFVLCVLMLLSCFGVCGSFGAVVSSLLFGLFGYAAYGFPVVLFTGVCFYEVNKGRTAAIVKSAAAAVAVPAACGLLHAITGNKELRSIGSAYRYCGTNHNGGGVIGAAVYSGLESAFGKVGVYVVLTALLIILAVIISERSFVKGVKKGSRKVYDSAKEESARRKERADEKKAKKRMEKKAYGVNMDLKFPETSVHKSEDMREIPGEPAEEEIPLRITPEPELAKLPEIPEEKPVKKPRRKQQPQPEETKEEPQKELEAPQPAAAVRNYQFPPLSLLNPPKNSMNKNSAGQLRETAMKLQQIMKDFGVNVTVTDVSCGPTVTRYELQPDHGVKVSRVLALADDIKLNLAVADIRIEAPIPGKAAIGIEVPNKDNATVALRELLASEEFSNCPSNLAFAVGKDIGGKTIITDIAKMPHLLIAGATGSGKSVCINTLIMSLLYKSSPEDVKLIMVDPKVVELSAYNGVPHLLIPVVTEPKKAAGALNWAVAEMTRRYQLFADYQVRNLQGYNEKVKSIEMLEDENKPQKLPQIVIIVDELADLMMVAPGEVEDAICRLAQLARAAGIHLIIATQRPSVNVITGLIKANMPSRLAFAVSSGVDSRTILDMNGAEKLLGKGDMLFYPYGYPKPVRIQGAFVSDEEVSAVVEFLKSHNESAPVNAEIEEHLKNQQSQIVAAGGKAEESGNDPLFADAGKFIIEKDKASIGMLQRWFKIGFNRAARIMDQLSEAGVVGEEQGTKPREILMSPEQFEEYLEEN